MTKPTFTGREDNDITGQTIFYDKHGNMDIFSRETQLKMKSPYFNFKEEECKDVEDDSYIVLNQVRQYKKRIKV